jgi:hypothetical protein
VKPSTWESPTPRHPSIAPLTAPCVEIRRHAPIVSRTKGAVWQRDFSCLLSTEEVASAMSMHLMHHVPKAMQKVPNYEYNWHSNTQKAQDSERNHTSNFESPRSLIPTVGGER